MWCAAVAAKQHTEAYQCWRSTPAQFSVDGRWPVREVFVEAKKAWERKSNSHPVRHRLWEFRPHILSSAHSSPCRPTSQSTGPFFDDGNLSLTVTQSVMAIEPVSHWLSCAHSSPCRSALKCKGLFVDDDVDNFILSLFWTLSNPHRMAMFLTCVRSIHLSHAQSDGREGMSYAHQIEHGSGVCF